MRFVVAAILAAALAAPVYAAQAPVTKGAPPTQAQRVQAIRHLTQEICDIYPDAHCVLDERSDRAR